MNKGEELALKLFKEGKISADKDGRVWRHWDGRNNVKHWLKIPREIKPELRKDKSRKNDVYLSFGLSNYQIRVHRFVWIAFHGKIPGNLEINHKDGNKLNNRLKNLELMTTQENAIHAHGIGLIKSAKGESVGSAKLTEKDIIEIRRLYKKKLSTRKIALKFNVSYHQIWMIVTKKVGHI